MGATPQQIASAKQLAQSRGYDPNLVDEDNADRANIAFPSQGGGYTGGAGYKPPSGTSIGPPMGQPSAPAEPSTTPPYQLSTPGGPTVPTGVGSTDALNKVAEPATSQGGGLGAAGLALSAIGGGGATGNQENTAVDGQSGGVLRPLGYRRNPPASMQALFKRAY